jgi:signal transduction histidine kinase
LIAELAANRENTPEICLFETASIPDETITFVSKIRNLSPGSVLLVIGEATDLLFIQQQNQSQPGFYYLAKPFSTEELNLAINTSLSFSASLKKLVDCANNDHKIEERVNESLQKLIDANMAKDQFLSIISHDLKSPIHTILGVTEILLNEEGNLTEKDKIEFISDINKTAGETHTLLINLLEWSKIQKEKLKVTITEVNVKELVDFTLNTSHNHASLKGIEVKNEICDDIKVRTDKNMMATVFRNLISNAVQYTQPGGNINISAFETNDGCTFCVADNGSGVEKIQILDYFQKGNTKKINGNAHVFKGLGLLICKDFVEKTGGEIWLETVKGKGSKFYFTVPA